MIHVKANSNMLLFRYNNYKKNDFITEHLRCMDSAKHVWFLKAGKKMPDYKIEKVMEDGGYLVLRAPKKDGGQYYLAHMDSYYYGHPNGDMLFPKYYSEMVNDQNLWNIESLEGTWIKIDRLESISNEDADNLLLVSNNKKVEEVIKTTRSAIMYIYCSRNITTKMISGRR